MYSLLIVEDELLPRTALHSMITTNFPEFTDVREAASSEEAMEIMRTYRPDILLVDINLLGRTGLELCQQLADQGLAGHTIITTAYGRFSYARQAMDIGCQAYLLKPINDPICCAVSEKTASLRHCFKTATDGLRTDIYLLFS